MPKNKVPATEEAYSSIVDEDRLDDLLEEMNLDHKDAGLLKAELRTKFVELMRSALALSSQ